MALIRSADSAIDFQLGRFLVAELSKRKKLGWMVEEVGGAYIDNWPETLSGIF